MAEFGSMAVPSNFLSKSTVWKGERKSNFILEKLSIHKPSQVIKVSIRISKSC